MDEIELQTGVRVGINQIGEGQPLLLLAGLGMPAIVWEFSSLSTQLADAGFSVISFNARGIPPSTAPPAPYTVDDLAADAKALLHELGHHSNVIVVGYSLGTYVAQALLRQHPDIFSAAVLIAGLNPSPILELVDTMELDLIESTGSLPTAVSTFELLMTILPMTTVQDPEAISGWQDILGDDKSRWTSVDGLAGQLSASRSWSRDRTQHLETLSTITIPTLSVAFEHDVFFPPANERAAADRIPGCEHVVIPDAAHGGLSTHPDEPIKHIVDFCTRVQTSFKSRT